MEQEKAVVQRILERFPVLEGHVRVQREKRVVMDHLVRRDFEKVFPFLTTSAGFDRLLTLFGTDDGDWLGLTYALANEDEVVLLARQRVPKSRPIIRSVGQRFPQAVRQEQELRALLGLEVEDLSQGGDPLPGDWPQGSYPLRKAWDPRRFNKSAMIYDQPTRPAFEETEAGGGRQSVTVAAANEKNYSESFLRASLERDRVAEARLPAGASHMGVEKSCELHSYMQDLLILERFASLGPQAHTLAFCQAMEELAGVEAPQRAQHIRLIVSELERLQCHLLWLAGTAREVGYGPLNAYLLNDRELVLDCLAEIGGNRIKYSVNLPGGVRRDLDEHVRLRISEMLHELERRIRKHCSLFRRELMLVNRLRGAGNLSLEQAEVYGAVGPLARGAGLRRDVRCDEPYGLYKNYDIQPVVDGHGDAYGRAMVHLGEMDSAIELIRRALDELPEGPLSVAVPPCLPAGEALSRVEAPRGELVYFLRSGGGPAPERLRIFTPRKANMCALEKAICGSYLANVPLLMTDYDFCFGSVERAVVISQGAEGSALGWEELRDISREHYLRQESEAKPSSAGLGTEKGGRR